MDRTTQGQTGPQEQPEAAGTPGPAARVVRLTTGEYTVTVNPVDGSEIEARRPGDGSDRRPDRRDAASRAEHATA
ncbi:hypothetical protein, partial [Streptomyces bambusae]